MTVVLALLSLTACGTTPWDEHSIRYDLPELFSHVGSTDFFIEMYNEAYELAESLGCEHTPTLLPLELDTIERDKARLDAGETTTGVGGSLQRAFDYTLAGYIAKVEYLRQNNCPAATDWDPMPLEG